MLLVYKLRPAAQYVDNILPTLNSPTRFINTGGLAVDPLYSVKASAYLPSGASTNDSTCRADDGTISSVGSLSLYPTTSVKIFLITSHCFAMYLLPQLIQMIS